MDAHIQIERTLDDLADATILGMQASGFWGRTVASTRRMLAITFLLLALSGVLILQDLVLAVGMTIAGCLFVWLTPRMLMWSGYKRFSRQVGEQAAACLGSRTLWITDHGLSDSGSGITTTVAWDRITDHVVNADRHVFAAGLAAIIDLPRRGDTAAVDHFAAHADARIAAARTPLPA